MAVEIKTDMYAPLEKRNWQDTHRIPSVYCNLSPADLFALRPRFISMTCDTYLHDERPNWNKQVKSLTRRTEHTRCSKIKKAKIVPFTIFVLIICQLKENLFVYIKSKIYFKNLK